MVDEVGFIPKWFLDKVVWPVLTNQPPVLCISTKNKDDDKLENPVNEYVEMNKEEKFIEIYESSPACDECRARGIPEKCKHKMKTYPSWQNPKQVKLLSKLIRNKDDLNREIFAIAGYSSQKAFDKRMVLNMRNLFRIVTKSSPDFVNITIDPAAEGEGSMYAIVTTYLYQGSLIVFVSFLY